MYEKELKALKRAGRFRHRKIFDKNLCDFASNDYLGFAEDKRLLKKAYEKLEKYPLNAAKASLLVNGYTEIHKNFEDDLCRINGFEAGIVLGSGFLANIALIEALPRRGDAIFIDEEYHASGVLAAKLTPADVVFFRHNDPDNLKKKINSKGVKGRVIIAVEGVYSMSGEVVKKEIFDIADETDALLIVDEAHSSGVLGQNLTGVFDYYNIPVTKKHIKMGTLGKAYGSYGAYILASNEIISFLENRAKSVIYTTALSIFDVLLAHEALKKIEKKKEAIKKKLNKRKKIVKDILGYDMESLILSVPVKNSKEALQLQEVLAQKGFLTGAIRPPTVKEPILRIIPRLKESCEDLKKLLREVKEYVQM
ncbi:aminotransferase class I/II-fold pyridoxal phosphate-dependent enzyme [Nitrosophilus alvini]|uniref:aminotransferase class I/II-fold pyridoxal phosphate-dependent enzyme n=1 Tax=Nitrosophilus alvini TaxID=2714855 RepID=UPI00190A05D2|nr:pyridoxal phosphate-dependent aminotransferase family protein [Nitrosophilus alvini]